MPHVYLALAIVLEVVATSALKASDGFTRLAPTILVALGYAGAFYCLSQALTAIQIGVAYAIWAGVGIALLTIVGALFFDETPDGPAILGILLIIAGVVVINVFSKASGH